MKNMIALAAELEREDHPAAKIVVTAIEKSNSPAFLAAIAAAMYDAALADLDDERRVEACIGRALRSTALQTATVQSADSFDAIEETFKRR